MLGTEELYLDTLRFCSRLKSSHQSQTSISIFFLFLSIPNDQDFPLHTHDQPLQLATNDQSFHAEESASDRIDISIHISLFELLFCLFFFFLCTGQVLIFSVFILVSIMASNIHPLTYSHIHSLSFNCMSSICLAIVLPTHQDSIPDCVYCTNQENDKRNKRNNSAIAHEKKMNVNSDGPFPNQF